MQVYVRLFGDFRQYLKELGGRSSVTLEEGATVRGLLDHLGVPEVEVGLVSVNRDLASVDAMLKDGDEVDVFSPIGGG